ncbi:hypothetical protein KP509_30G025000 [Ceratopteris richardii]|nr:hypothetical protein KP509_30G025000 [Ceratopteris richardii]
MCMCVCRQWREVAKEDYIWKLACSKRWPSTTRSSPSVSPSPSSSPACSSPIGSLRGYHKLFSSLSRHRTRPSPSPKLSFEALEFYVDIWIDSVPVYSDVIPGTVALSGILQPPSNICNSMKEHLQSPSSKMAILVNPPFRVSFDGTIRVSLLVRRCDRDQVACVIDRTGFDYVDGPGYKAHTYDYLQFSAQHPFVSQIRAWLALLLVDAPDGELEAFGIELDFGDVADSDSQILLLLDMLDWK